MRMIRFVAAVPIIIYLVITSNRDHNDYERNKQPKKDVRHAQNIAGMWSKGISAEYIPSFRPAKAETLLRNAIESDADESVKQEAREVQQLLNQNPYFIGFANEIDQFADEFNGLREVVRVVPEPEMRKVLDSDQGVQGKCLVVTAKQHASRQPEKDEDPLYFDAKLNNALGDSLATAPSELKTLIALYFFREKVGEYQFQPKEFKEGQANPFEAFQMNAYMHVCQIVVIDLSTKSVVKIHQIATDDPETKTIALLGTSKPEKGGYELLFEQVHAWIQNTSATAGSKSGVHVD